MDLGKTHIVVMWTVGPDEVAAGDAVFQSHGKWMEGHSREGGTADPGQARGLPAHSISATGALPLPEALNHRSAVQRDDLLGPAGPVHEGRQILPVVPGQPPVFDHAGR